jgi:hypothetical protein
MFDIVLNVFFPLPASGQNDFSRKCATMRLAAEHAAISPAPPKILSHGWTDVSGGCPQCGKRNWPALKLPCFWNNVRLALFALEFRRRRG